MVVVDTNVLAYLLIEGPHTATARSLFERDSDWRSDSFILVEFSNVLATLAQARRAPLAQLQGALGDARRLIGPGLLSAPHDDSLAVAAGLRISAYDARFLVAAQSLGSRLVTEDAKLRRAAPKLTQSLDQALSA